MKSNSEVYKNISTTPELDKLNVFIGKWKTEGTSYAEGSSDDDLKSSSVSMASEETFEWILDGAFIIHNWNGNVGKAAFKGMEIIGYDKKSNIYTSNFFDNAGNCPTYKLRVNNNAWTYTGELQKAIFEFSDDGNTIKIHWDWKKPGSENWLPLCDLKAIKIN
jgi:hypothetical protein